jgi:DNA-directed RNA polymerase alpha subunit
MTGKEPVEVWPKGVSQPAIRALNSAGYFRLGELTGVSESDLLRLHGIGPKSVRVIKQSLAERGYKPLAS